MARGEEVAARARLLVGARFRPQGRDAATGLDCIGVAAAAGGIDPARLPRDYQLRGRRLAEIEHGLCELGCRPVPGDEARAGDVFVCEAGPAQFHVVVLVEDGFVHADAGLRRVVERPLPVPWPIESIWRLAEGDE